MDEDQIRKIVRREIIAEHRRLAKVLEDIFYDNDPERDSGRVPFVALTDLMYALQHNDVKDESNEGS